MFVDASRTRILETSFFSPRCHARHVQDRKCGLCTLPKSSTRIRFPVLLGLWYLGMLAADESTRVMFCSLSMGCFYVWDTTQDLIQHPRARYIPYGTLSHTTQDPTLRKLQPAQYPARHCQIYQQDLLAFSRGSGKLGGYLELRTSTS